ncbi:hypothetical protein HY2_08670 [Hyphomonas pacifica]|nr:hypothetical protein HY2_08670 [Hyphomonas pacifica]
MVIDGDPVELRAEILFGLRHERAHRLSLSSEVCGVLGRDDEAELVSVTGATFFEEGTIYSVGVPAVEFAAFAIAVYTVPLNVSEMRPEGGGAKASGSTRDMDFHHDAPHAEFRVRCLAKKAGPSGAGSTGDLGPAECSLTNTRRQPPPGTFELGPESPAACGSSITKLAEARGELILPAHGANAVGALINH